MKLDLLTTVKDNYKVKAYYIVKIRYLLRF